MTTDKEKQEKIEEFRRPKKCEHCIAMYIHKDEEFGDIYLCGRHTNLCGDVKDHCSEPVTKKSLSQMDQIDI